MATSSLLLLVVAAATFVLGTLASGEGPNFPFATEELITRSHSLHPARQKLTHLRFYWHDVTAGPHPTAVTVVSAPATNSSPTFFGMVNMIDDALTLAPEMGPPSNLVGRAQGFYASASQETLGLIMAMNFVFVQGKYNGSTITVMGRNEVFTGVREMAVVGGSGLFRWARGYVQARTHKADLKTGNAVVHYDCFIMHY